MLVAVWAVIAFSVYVGLLVFRTRQIRRDIGEGIGKLSGQVDSRLEAIETRFNELTPPDGDDIALRVENAVNAKLEALDDELGPVISQHVLMAIRQEQAQATKSLQAQIEELGIPGVVEEGKEAVLAQLPPQMLQAQRLLSMKVSKKYAAEHPLEAQAIEAGKLWVMQMMNAQTGLLGQPAASEATATTTASRGFGVR